MKWWSYRALTPAKSSLLLTSNRNMMKQCGIETITFLENIYIETSVSRPVGITLLSTDKFYCRPNPQCQSAAVVRSLQETLCTVGQLGKHLLWSIEYHDLSLEEQSKIPLVINANGNSVTAVVNTSKYLHTVEKEGKKTSSWKCKAPSVDIDHNSICS